MSRPQSAPQVEWFECVAVTFTRGAGVQGDPVRTCTAYYRRLDDDDSSLVGVYDPQVGIDPLRYPPDADSPLWKART